MSKKQRQSSRHHHSSPTPIPVEYESPRIVAMTLASDFAAAVQADAQEKKDLIDAALWVGQWLADQGLPGRWDKIRPAQVLRCIDFLPLAERERFLFSLSGLVGHAALSGQIPAKAAKRTLDEVGQLSHEEAVLSFARQAGQHVQALIV